MLKVNSLTGFGGSSAGSTPLRGVFAGGDNSKTNIMDYIDIATLGNAVDFGDLSAAKYGLGACSDGSRGVFGGGYASNSQNVIDYITIATVGNATDFGDLTLARHMLAACASAVRGVFSSGYEAGATGGIGNTIDYITIASTGNATSFGNLSLGRSDPAACADATRGVVGGGYAYGYAKTDRIDYITIQTTGNATYFGTLTDNITSMGACADATRGVFGGGYATGVLNVIQYITIQTTGNATDFGDLTASRQRTAACSGA